MSERQYVIFKLGREEYGVDIMHVKEISEYIECTKVPNSPEFIEGIINYRGDIVAIINLYYKFNIDLSDITEDTRIIIFGIEGRQVGFLVEDASKVLTIDDKDIEEPPSIIMTSGEKFISGIGKVEDKIIIILELANLLSDKERKELEQIIE